MVEVHNRDPTENCENKCIMQNHLKGLKNHSDFLCHRPQYKLPSYMVSVFFMLLKIPNFPSSFTHLQSTQGQNQK